MSDLEHEPQHTPPATTVVHVVETRTSVFVRQHGIGLVALLLAIAACVMAGVALCRSGDQQHWRTCPPVMYGAMPFHGSYSYERPCGWMMPDGSSGGGTIQPVPMPPVQVNPGGPMIPAPGQQTAP